MVFKIEYFDPNYNAPVSISVMTDTTSNCYTPLADALKKHGIELKSCLNFAEVALDQIEIIVHHINDGRFWMNIQLVDFNPHANIILFVGDCIEDYVISSSGDDVERTVETILLLSKAKSEIAKKITLMREAQLKRYALAKTEGSGVVPGQGDH